MKNFDFSQTIFELSTKVFSLISDQISGLYHYRPDLRPNSIKGRWTVQPSPFSSNRSSLSSHLHQLSPMLTLTVMKGFMPDYPKQPFMEERNWGFPLVQSIQDSLRTLFNRLLKQKKFHSSKWKVAKEKSKIRKLWWVNS